MNKLILFIVLTTVGIIVFLSFNEDTFKLTNETKKQETQDANKVFVTGLKPAPNHDIADSETHKPRSRLVPPAPPRTKANC